MGKPGRKRRVDLPPNFNSLRIKDSARVRTSVTEKEIEKMRELRELGLSYQKIAEVLGRSKTAVMWYLKEPEWVEERKRKNRENAKDWYDNKDGRAWRHEAYERRKELCRRGELE